MKNSLNDWWNDWKQPIAGTALVLLAAMAFATIVMFVLQSFSDAEGKRCKSRGGYWYCTSVERCVCLRRDIVNEEPERP